MVKKILIILGVLLVILVGCAVFFFQFTHSRKQMSLEDMATGGPDWEAYVQAIDDCAAWLKDQETEQVEITSFDGLRLKGTYIPVENAKACVILFHGYRSSAQYDFSGVILFYAKHGFSTLFVDQRACGESEGKYLTFGMNERHDVCSWAEYVDQRFGGKMPIVLHGLSMGATSVMMAADLPMPNSVVGLIADCGFTTPYDIIAHCAKQWFKMPAFPAVDALSWIAKTVTGCGYRDCSTLDTLSRSDLPLFLIHGAKDNFVPAYMTEENYSAAKDCRGKLIVDDAGHAISYLKDPQRYEERVLEYLESIL